MGTKSKLGKRNMSDFDLEALSLDQLKDLQKNVAKAIAGYEERKRKEALTVLEDKARELGFSLDELTGKPKAKAKGAPAKYRNPEGDQTWSGRGRQPAWFKAALEAGKSPDDLLI